MTELQNIIVSPATLIYGKGEDVFFLILKMIQIIEIKKIVTSM